MNNIEGLSNEELKSLIVDQLSDMDLLSDSIKVKIIKPSTVMLSGEIESYGEKELIKLTIMDILGVDDIIDELIVIRGETNESDDYEDKENEYYDEDDCLGTEDASQAIEEGIPYIPPVRSPIHNEAHKSNIWNKKRKKRV